MTPPTLTLCLVMLGVALFPAARANAAEAPDEKVVKALLAGWRAERDKLVKGKVQLVGAVQQGIRASTTTTLYSFDRKLGSKKGLLKPGKQDSVAWLHTPDYFAQCVIDGSPVVSVGLHTDVKLGPIKDLDPRCIGFMLIGDYSYPPEFEAVVDRFSKYKLVKVTRAANGCYEVEWSRDAAKLSLRMIAVFNPRKGHSIERFQVLMRPPHQTEWLSASLAEQKWVRRNGVWVPERVTFHGLLTHRLELSLRWDKVNEALAADEFEIDSMGVPVGTIIGDGRRARANPTIIGRVGQKTLIPPPPPPPNPAK